MPRVLKRALTSGSPKFSSNSLEDGITSQGILDRTLKSDTETGAPYVVLYTPYVELGPGHCRSIMGVVEFSIESYEPLEPRKGSQVFRISPKKAQ